MISEDFMSLVKKFKSTSSTEDIKTFNELILSLEQKQNNEAESYFFSKCRIISDVYIKSILKDSFQWTKEIGEELKLFFKSFENLKSPLFIQIANCNFFETVFNLRFFELIVGVNMGRIGGSTSYDESLRANSYMLRFFVNVYLRKMLAFKPLLKSSSVHLYDPCFREKLREKNQTDPEIKKLLFNDEFDIKRFASKCLERFFPNVSWRWQGGQQFAHYMTLKMILILFEYGLYGIEEIEVLIAKIYSVSEILCNLETYLKRDTEAKSFGVAQVNEWTKCATKCRKKIGSIFLHIMLMHLDTEIMAVLPQFKIPVASFFASYPLYTAKFPTEIESLFYVKRFKKKRLYTYFSYSLVTYLVRPMLFGSASSSVDSKTLKNIVGILIGYVSDMENNMFNISLNTLQAESFSFYLLAANIALYDVPKQYEEKFKYIIKQIKLCAYGTLNYENTRFLNEVSDLFRQITNFFNLIPKKIEVYCGYQIAFVLTAIPQYILSLINFIVEMGASERNILKTVKIGVAALISICRENNQAINSIFSHYNFKHILKLLKNDVINGVYLVVKLFGKSSTLYILEKNNEIFESLIDNYLTILTEFSYEVSEWKDTGEIIVQSKNMAAVMIYSKLFRRILKNSEQKNFKFQILISDKMHKICSDFLLALADKNIQAISKFDENPMEFKRIENFFKMTTEWEKLNQNDKESVFYEALYLTLSLFDQSIKKVFTSKIYDCFDELFKHTNLTNFLSMITSTYGMRMFKVTLQIFSTLKIFHQNHLLDRESLLVSKNDIKIEEYLRSEQTDPFIYTQLISVLEPTKAFINKYGVSSLTLDFLLTSLLPSIFKLYSGLLTHFTENKFKEFRREKRLKFIDYAKIFLDFVLSVREIIHKSEGPKDKSTSLFIVNFKKLYQDTDPMYFFQQTFNPEVDMFRTHGYQLMDVIVDLYSYKEKKIIHIEELIRYNYYDFEESTNNIMKDKLEFFLKFRNEGHIAGEKKIVVWDKAKKSIKAYEQMKEDTNAEAGILTNRLKNFDFEMPEEDNTKGIISLQIQTKTVENFGELNPIIHNEWSNSPKSVYIENIIVYLKDRYKYMKIFFLDNNNTNQIFIVFRLEDIIKKNIQLFIDYFFEQMKLLDIDFESLTENFFTNEFYYSLFILMDNLIRTSKNYRRIFYNKIQEEGGNEIIGKIWRLHRMLLDYCLYSTFLDSSWKQIFTCYYLVSNFIQNLCEDNFFLFKRWFCQENDFLDNNTSILEFYYALIETAFKNTELPQYNRQKLTLADKPELFLVYNRLIEGMTEFINGGKTMGQQMVYQKRIDIWVGIIMRIIDDVDSPFYILKYNVLLYISATLEGLDRNVVEFIASNFSINRTFRLMVRLMKKLYIRQVLLKKNKRLIGSSNAKPMISAITEEDEKTHSVGSFGSLMDFYKKYEATFADHVIMNTLIDLYSFIGTMSTGVVRYKNFLNEINAMARAVFVDKKNFQNEEYNMESITIWYFLKSIIVEMEIVYKDSSSDEETPKLILHHFKKLPICFFLTDSVKENFLFYVNIESIDLKHEEFFRKSKSHAMIMRDLRQMYKKSKFLFQALTEDSFRIYMVSLYFLGVVINILFLILHKSDNNEFLQWNPLNLHLSVLVLAAIDAFLAFCILILWFTFKYPIIKKIKWEEYYLLNSKSKKAPWLTIFNISIIKSIIKKKYFRNFFLHVALSLLGLLISPFFYSLLLLLVVDLSFLVYSVIISFVNNYDKLAYTLLMIVVVINFFAYLASDVFEIDFTGSEDNKMLCVTYFTCLVNSVNVGLRAGSGLADKMTLNSDNHSSYFEARFIFDVMFFILVNIILLGMFFGIIVDSFKEQRDALERRTQDQTKECFTCGLQKDELEKAGIDFDKHVQYHDIWNYLFYLIYLEWKPKNSYDGVDLYVADKVETNSRHEWMPIKRTFSFGKDKAEK